MHRDSADDKRMESATLPVQTEIQFLISLLNIASPGQPDAVRASAIEQLLPASR